MAVEVRSFQVIVPFGTPATAPLTFNLSMPPRLVEEVQIQVPPGPRGEVGFALGAAGKQVYPYEPGTWIVTDAEVIRWPLQDAISSGAWQLIAYNTGTFNHTLYVRFLVRPTQTAASSAGPAPLSAAALSNSGSGGG